MALDEMVVVPISDDAAYTLGTEHGLGEHRRRYDRHRLARDEHLPSRSGRMEDSAPPHRLLVGGGGSPRRVGGGPRRGVVEGRRVAAPAYLLPLFTEVLEVGVLGSLARRRQRSSRSTCRTDRAELYAPRSTFRWVFLHSARITIQGNPIEGGSKWARFCGTDRATTDEIERRVGPNDDQTNEKGTVTMKLTTNTNVSVDGVMQGLGGPDEDRRGGFERGGWAMPHFDSETAALTGQVYQRADAFLFGRRTYEVFAGSWGTGSWGANQGDNPISVALNTRPKYVASTTLTDPRWADTTVLSGDVAAAVGELKAKPGGELQVVGSLSLVRWLLDNDLVDEITLLTYPVVVGQGARLFPDTGQDTALELVESRATTSGVTMQVYRTAGRPQYG